MLRLKSESTILLLRAKDKRTGKEQKIRIEAGSGQALRNQKKP